MTDPCTTAGVQAIPLRVFLLLALLAPAYAQTPASYFLNVSIPADPAPSLGSANGLMPMVVALGGGNLAPGAFFTVSATARFADGRFAFTCGIDPSLASVQLHYASGHQLNVRPFRLPAGFGTPRAGCEPLAAVLPHDAPLGAAELSFSYPQISATLPVRVEPAWVALLTPLDQSLSRPYRGGETVSLRTSGLGLTPLDEVTIVAGGIPQPALSRQPDPLQQGFDRVAFRMPEDAEDTCYLPVYLRTLAGETASVFVPKANAPGPCPHPLRLSDAQLAALDNGDRIWIAQPSLTVFERDRLIESSAIFQNAERWRVAMISAPEDSRTCRVLTGTPLIVPPDILRTTFGDGGFPLALFSPEDRPQTLNADPATLTYFSRFNFESTYAGQWTLRVPGGLDIAAFEAQVLLPQLPSWTPPQHIDRTADLTIAWNTEGLTSLHRVTLAAGSGFGPYVECRAPADAGVLTIPARFLDILTPSSQGLLSLGVSPSSSHRSLFSFPLPAAAETVGVFDYRLVSTIRDLPIE